MQESNYLSNDFLTKINEIKDKMKTDISLMKEFMQHMNRKFNRNEDEFLTNNISIIQIGLIRKEMNDLKNEINIILDSLNEIKEIKKELGELNKNILFEFI
jgi:hypothetical protein